MKYKSPIGFLNDNLSHITINRSLITQLNTFRIGWMTKSSDYIDFLGSNLLGVHVIRFSTQDDNKLMKDILRINTDELQKKYDKFYKEYLIFRGDKNLDVKRSTGTNVIYLTIIYLIHRFLTTNKLNSIMALKGAKELCLILQYKMFSSRYTRYFNRYNVNEPTATTVYEKLSKKYLIKRLESWQDVFEYRSNECLNKDNKSYFRLVTFMDLDGELVLTNLKTKINSSISEIFQVLLTVIQDKEIIKTEAMIKEGDEDEESSIREITDSKTNVINYIKDIANNTNNFINTDLVKIILELTTNITEQQLYKFLSCMSDTEFVKHKTLMYIVEQSMVINYEYLMRNNISLSNRENIPRALIMVRNYWSSSKVKNKDMVKIKNELKKLCKICTGKRTTWLLITLSIAYVTYVFLRALKK